MTKNDIDKNTDELSQQTRRIAALRIAAVAGVFSLIVLALMFVNFNKRRVASPTLEKNLEVLKVQFQDAPENQALMEVIRQLDLQIRRDRMNWLTFSRRGALLLLGGIAIALAAIRYADSINEKTIALQAARDSQKAQQTQAILSRRAVGIGVIVLLIIAGMLAFKSGVDYLQDETVGNFAENWPCFRGPQGNGVSNHTDVPLTFNIETGEHLLWKTKIPLDGMNSPIVWEDKVFLSGATEDKQQIFCFDAVSGELLWARDVPHLAPQGSDDPDPMEDTGYAAPTLATDGKRVYAIFATGDIAAFDFKGKQVWAKNLGTPDSMYGYASSLAMFEKLVIVQYDQGAIEDGLSRIFAFDGFSGQLVWQTKRPVANSWASPVIVKIGDGPQLITCADPFAISYDPSNGTELWRAKCLSGDVAPLSIYAAGHVFAINPYNAMHAIRPDGLGDVTGTHIDWRVDDEIPDICSPTSDGRLVYLLTTEGIITCYDATDGSKVWDNEFDDMFQASPSVVGDKVVLITEKGSVIVVAAGREFKEISRSELGDRCFASPAFANGRMFIRGTENLYCIGESK